MNSFEVRNIILPKSFHEIINHARRLKSEINGLVFHSVPIKFFEDDIIKMESMSIEEQIDYAIKLREEGRYVVDYEKV